MQKMQAAAPQQVAMQSMALPQTPITVQRTQQPSMMPNPMQAPQQAPMPMQTAREYGGEGDFTADDLAAAQVKTGRNKALADALFQNAIGPRATQTASGGMAVRQSPLEFLARGGQAYFANQGVNAAQDAEAADQKKYREQLTKAMQDLQAAQQPAMSPYGRGMTKGFDEQDMPAPQMEAPNPQNVQAAAMRAANIQGMGPDVARAQLVQALSGPRAVEYDTKPQIDQNGRQFVVGKDGSVKYLGQGQIQSREKPELVDAGGAKLFINPFTMQEQGRVTVGVDPNTNAKLQAEAIEKARLESLGAVPAGYRRKADGGVEPIPGGEAGQLKPMNDAQAKALLFSSRMGEAEKIIERMAAPRLDKQGNVIEQGETSPGKFKQAVEMVPVIGGVLGSLANITQSKEQQQVEQAQRDFINAVLRRESGAVIAESEFKNAQDQYFPKVGDSPEVIAQKRNNRILAQQAIMAEVPESHRKMPGLPKPSQDRPPLAYILK
jgi:hypothetical protein